MGRKGCTEFPCTLQQSVRETGRIGVNRRCHSKGADGNGGLGNGRNDIEKNGPTDQLRYFVTMNGSFLKPRIATTHCWCMSNASRATATHSSETELEESPKAGMARRIRVSNE
jgi:hypothetical protein